MAFKIYDKIAVRERDVSGRQRLPEIREIHFDFMSAIIRDDPEQKARVFVILNTIREYIPSGIGPWINPQFNSEIIIDPSTNRRYEYKELKDHTILGTEFLNNLALIEGLPT